MAEMSCWLEHGQLGNWGMNAGVHFIFHPFLNLGHQSAVFPTVTRGLTTSNATAAGGADVTEVLGVFVFVFVLFFTVII